MTMMITSFAVLACACGARRLTATACADESAQETRVDEDETSTEERERQSDNDVPQPDPDDRALVSEAVACHRISTAIVDRAIDVFKCTVTTRACPWLVRAENEWAACQLHDETAISECEMRTAGQPSSAVCGDVSDVWWCQPSGVDGTDGEGCR